MRTDADYAADLDRADSLAHLRERFYLPPDRLYFDGNSLGLLSRDAEAAVLRVLDEWKTLGDRRLAGGRHALVLPGRGARRG